ncbi:MAG: hypothetical protein ISR78_04685 [Spirochaetia bacterium]|nr:hypothetical protein [Spirochaetia bacterium]
MAKANVQEWKGTKKLTVKIRGVSPLIMHKWSEKAKRAMLDKQQKKTVKKELRDPKDEFERSVYKFSDGRLGFPADAFKKAMIRGAKQLGLVMTDSRGAFFIIGEYCNEDQRDLVPIAGELSMREDMVRLNGATSDLRYRGQVSDWTADIEILYSPIATSPDYLKDMLKIAGFGVGIGEWRPDKDGIFGRFEIIEN